MRSFLGDLGQNLDAIPVAQFARVAGVSFLADAAGCTCLSIPLHALATGVVELAEHWLRVRLRDLPRRCCALTCHVPP